MLTKTIKNEFREILLYPNNIVNNKGSISYYDKNDDLYFTIFGYTILCSTKHVTNKINQNKSIACSILEEWIKEEFNVDYKIILIYSSFNLKTTLLKDLIIS